MRPWVWVPGGQQDGEAFRSFFCFAVASRPSAAWAPSNFLHPSQAMAYARWVSFLPTEEQMELLQHPMVLDLVLRGPWVATRFGRWVL